MEKLPLIILPGWSGNDALWQHQIKHLKMVCAPQVIVIDNAVGTIENMAKAVISQAPSCFALAGHSLGGWLAQHIALKVPHRVKRMILMGTWTGALTPELEELIKENLRRINAGEAIALMDELRPYNFAPCRANDKKLFTLMKSSQDAFPISGLVNQLQVVMHGGDTLPHLDKIQCPTLVIQGAEDSFFRLEDTETWVSKLPQGTLTVIEDCGHMLSIEQPQAVTALLRLWMCAS